VGLLIAVGVLFVAAVNTGANLVYLMTALIFSLFLVSIVLSRREARGIESTIRLPVEGREGDADPPYFGKHSESAFVISGNGCG